MGGKRYADRGCRLRIEHSLIQTHTCRNLARSRAKDAVGRAQRRHFGLQRMQSVFTQGLTTSAMDSVPRRDHGVAEISLAHARRESAESAHSNENEDQYHDRRESSPDRQSAASKSSERSRSSRVLRALNVEERELFFMWLSFSPL
jgi:hypothetical protein